MNYHDEQPTMDALTEMLAKISGAMFDEDLINCLGFKEHERKAKRGDLARAKRCAWALRHDLRLVADFHGWVTREFVEELIRGYLDVCRRLCVEPPVVRVPRSLRPHFGRTIGGPTQSPWDAVSDMNSDEYILSRVAMGLDP